MIPTSLTGVKIGLYEECNRGCFKHCNEYTKECIRHTVPAPFFCPKTRFGLVFTTLSFRFGFVLVWFRFLAFSVF